MSAHRREVEAGVPGRRVLIVDDNPSICQDFKKILCPVARERLGARSLDSLENTLFGRSLVPPPRPSTLGAEFLVDTAAQGSEGLDAVRRMVKLRTPYAVAFIDMRMPPGWDGVETSARIWEADPAIQIVICSAYSDYSWHEVVRRLNRPELRLLQKPFESKDVLDLAWALTSKRLRQARPEMR